MTTYACKQGYVRDVQNLIDIPDFRHIKQTNKYQQTNIGAKHFLIPSLTHNYYRMVCADHLQIQIKKWPYFFIEIKQMILLQVQIFF